MNSFQIAPPPKPIGDRYLSFYLNRQTPALLLMEYAQEVIIVATSRLSPMPNMPEREILNQELRLMQQQVLFGIASASDAVSETDRRIRERLALS